MRTMSTAPSAHFTPVLFQFLRDLWENNNRPWFEANRRRFEDDVRELLTRFVVDFAPHLQEISPRLAIDQGRHPADVLL